MRAPTFFAILVGVMSHLTASAQAPGTQDESKPDFSGAYVSDLPIGVTTYTQPDDYPFTTEGERGHNAFDPLVADPHR